MSLYFRTSVITYFTFSHFQFFPLLFGWYILYSWFRASSLYINKIQQDATDVGIYLLQNYYTCFGCLSHPSSEIHQTVTAASGTGHITYQGNDLLPAWPNYDS